MGIAITVSEALDVIRRAEMEVAIQQKQIMGLELMLTVTQIAAKREQDIRQGFQRFAFNTLCQTIAV